MHIGSLAGPAPRAAKARRCKAAYQGRDGGGVGRRDAGWDGAGVDDVAGPVHELRSWNVARLRRQQGSATVSAAPMAECVCGMCMRAGMPRNRLEGPRRRYRQSP